VNVHLTDVFDQTIIHYAARQGRLGILKHLSTLNLDFEKGNKYGISPVIYSLVNQQVYTFVFLAFKMGCELTPTLAMWSATEMVKS
jgi:hypothetical protein